MTTKKFRVMAATVPLVKRDDRGIEIAREYHNQGAEIDLEPNDEQTKRYVKLGAVLDIKAADEKEAADKKAQAELLMAQAKAAADRARALVNEPASQGQRPEDLPPEQGGPTPKGQAQAEPEKK